MKSYIDRIKTDLSRNPPNYGEDGIDSILGLLYRYYAEVNPVDSEEIRAGFRELRERFGDLELREFDPVFDLVCMLCARHEEIAFRQGFRTGAQLMLELGVEG